MGRRQRNKFVDRGEILEIQIQDYAFGVERDDGLFNLLAHLLMLGNHDRSEARIPVSENVNFYLTRSVGIIVYFIG